MTWGLAQEAARVTIFFLVAWYFFRAVNCSHHASEAHERGESEDAIYWILRAMYMFFIAAVILVVTLWRIGQ